MDVLLVVIIIGLFVYWIIKGKPKHRDPPPKATEPETPKEAEKFTDPTAALRVRITQWQADHYEAFLLMTVAALADGKASREELRLMARFFAEQGAPANDEELAGIDLLKGGLTLRLAGTPDIADLIGSMAGRSRNYLLSLYGALYALTGTKRPNARNAALLGAIANTLLDTLPP